MSTRHAIRVSARTFMIVGPIAGVAAIPLLAFLDEGVPAIRAYAPNDGTLIVVILFAYAIGAPLAALAGVVFGAIWSWWNLSLWPLGVAPCVAIAVGAASGALLGVICVTLGEPGLAPVCSLAGAVAGLTAGFLLRGAVRASV